MDPTTSAHFRALYGRARVALDDFSAAQSLLVALYGAASSIILRLTLISQPAHYEALVGRDEAPQLAADLVARQEDAFADVVASLMRQVGLLASASAVLSKIAADAAQLLAADGGALRRSPASRPGTAAASGLSLPAELLDGLVELSDRAGDDVALVQLLISRLAADTSAEELAACAHLMAAPPGLGDALRVWLLQSRAPPPPESTR